MAPLDSSLAGAAPPAGRPCPNPVIGVEVRRPVLQSTTLVTVVLERGADLRFAIPAAAPDTFPGVPDDPQIAECWNTIVQNVLRLAELEQRRLTRSLRLSEGGAPAV